MSVMLDKLLKGQKVEWLKLGDVAKFVNGRAYKQPELLEQGKYPVLRVGNFFTNANWYYSDLELDADKYADNGDLLYAWSASFGPRIWQGDKVIYHYHIWKVIPNEQKILKKFLYHILEWDTNSLKNEYANGSTMMHITKGTIEQRLMPIPPLDVQAEIVRILDAFTALTAELTMRAKQYHYYRDKLLTFSDDEVEWKTLGEVANISSGGTPSKTNDSYWLNGDIPWLKSEVCKNCIVDESKTFITNLGLKNSSAKFLKVGTVLMAMVGATIFKTAYLTFEATTNQNIAAIKSKSNLVLDKYIFYFLINSYDELTSKLEGYNMINLSQIKLIKIPIPSLKEQKRIIAILDKFETITKSITEGLPKEIALRQQQYEYYREQLLDFPK